MTRDNPSLLWVFPGRLASALDSATWIETSEELRKLGWEVTLVAAMDAKRLDTTVHVVLVPKPRGYFLGHVVFHALVLWQVVRRRQSTDVVLCHQDSAPFLLAIPPIRNILGAATPKVVMDSRTVFMATSTIRGRVHAAFFSFAHHMANWLADGQTAITPRMAQVAKIPDRQLVGIWPSGVKVERFRSAVARRHFPVDDDPLRLIYIGSIEPERNLSNLCEAVRLARASGVPVTLEIVGEGSMRAELAQREAAISDGAISIRPAVPYSAVPDVLATGHVGVLPFPDETRIRVSSFIKLFEYMASGLPILATRVVAHTDVLQDSPCVFWARDASASALAEAISNAWAKRASLREMSNCMAASAQSWSWESSARRLSDALLRVLDAGRVQQAETTS